MKTAFSYNWTLEARSEKREARQGKFMYQNTTLAIKKDKTQCFNKRLPHFFHSASCILTILITAMAFFATNTAMAADQQWTNRSKTIEETVAISSTATVEIANKYGRIEIDTWNKDSLYIEVSISAQAKNFDKVERIMDRINIDMNTESEDFMIFRTEIGSGKGSSGILGFFQDLWDSTSDLTNSLLNTQNVTVDYKVFLPESVKLTIENRFGDVLLPTVKGALRTDIEHGDLHAKDIWNARNISAKYGKLDIENIRQGNLNLSFVDAVIESAGSLQVESRSSNINLEEVEHLEVDANYDEWYIGSAESVNGSQVSTDLRVRNLSKSIDITSKYGSVDVSRIEPQVKSVNLFGNYTDYSLGFNPSVSYDFNVSLKEGDNFYFPEKNAKIQADSVSEEGMRHIDGKVTSSKESYSTSKGDTKGTEVRIKTRNGSVHLGYNK
ncbi:MAG: hypothetical protein R3E32_29850 [Chitinophagales bacterium]